MPTPITMPALSPTMTEGTLARWLKAEGDTVEPGDVIAEIETDKATMEVEAVDEGVLAKILVEGGAQGVAVGATIAVLAEEGEDVSVYQAPESTTAAAEPEAAPTQKDTPQEAPTVAPAEPGRKVAASPLARRIAQDKGLDLATIQGSGPRGRIVKRDMEGATPAPAPLPAATTGAAPTQIPHTTMRRVIAQRLSESKATIPHFYVDADCQLDALLAARATINARADGAYKISVNDFIVRASAAALMAVPAAHVAWGADALTQFHSADIAVAVTTDGGLITPIVRDAQTKSLSHISAEVKDLAARARDNALRPEEFQGGSFTLSNLGMYGVSGFSAIVNPPQAIILAVGAGAERVVAVDGAPAVRSVMTARLSVDHRAIDGAVAAQWLAAFKGFVEDPITLLA